jgi:hypothetical protein
VLLKNQAHNKYYFSFHFTKKISLYILNIAIERCTACCLCIAITNHFWAKLGNPLEDHSPQVAYIRHHLFPLRIIGTAWHGPVPRRCDSHARYAIWRSCRKLESWIVGLAACRVRRQRQELERDAVGSSVGLHYTWKYQNLPVSAANIAWPKHFEKTLRYINRILTK